MKIEILGTGCAKCKMLEENTKKALAETQKKADVIKITDIEQIMSYGVMSTPAIVVDGKLKAYGRVVTPDEIMKWL